MLALSVSLFSGQTLDVQIPSDASLNRLKRLVQSKLQKPVASLARRSGRPLPELGSVAAEGLEDGEELTVVLQQHDRLCSHPDGLCFSAIRRNGTVKFWGNALCEVCGGPPDFPPRTELFHVQKIVAAQNAFAAIRTDGRVVTWGECCAGGETSPAVAEQLVEVQEISATSKAFAAIRSDGSVVTWGFAYLGGNSSAVQLELVDVKEIVGSPFAFAAIRADGAVVTWGTPNRGGDSSAVADQLRKDVISVVASNLAFTALKADGTVVSWGDPLRGGNSQDVQKDLKGVKLIRPCNAAFAALRHDGLVVTWGDPERGGNSSPDMAASVSALEIFADRQPVDFGLTAVVELWLGPNQTLPAKSGDDLTRYAWTSDPSSPQWLSAVQVSEQDRAEKAVYAWRLKAQLNLMLEAREATTEKDEALRQCDALERRLHQAWVKEAPVHPGENHGKDLVACADSVGADAVESMLRAESVAMRTAIRFYEKQQEDSDVALEAQREREALWKLEDQQAEEAAELDAAEERLVLGEACIADAFSMVETADDFHDELADLAQALARQKAALEVAQERRDAWQDQASDLRHLLASAEARAVQLEKKLTSSSKSKAADALDALRQSGYQGAAALVVVLARLCGGPRLAFLAIDANNSGAVSTYEFDSALRMRLGLDYEAITGLKLRSLFKAFDTRHCGLVYGVDMVSAFADIWRAYGLPEEIARDPLLNPDLEGPAQDEVLREQQRWLMEARARSRRPRSSSPSESRTPRTPRTPRGGRDVSLSPRQAASPRELIRDEWQRGYHTVGIPLSPRSLKAQTVTLPGVSPRSQHEDQRLEEAAMVMASSPKPGTLASPNRAGTMADSKQVAAKHQQSLQSPGSVRAPVEEIEQQESSRIQSPNRAGATADSKQVAAKQQSQNRPGATASKQVAAERHQDLQPESEEGHEDYLDDLGRESGEVASEDDLLYPDSKHSAEPKPVHESQGRSMQPTQRRRSSEADGEHNGPRRGPVSAGGQSRGSRGSRDSGQAQQRHSQKESELAQRKSLETSGAKASQRSSAAKTSPNVSRSEPGGAGQIPTPEVMSKAARARSLLYVAPKTQGTAPAATAEMSGSLSSTLGVSKKPSRSQPQSQNVQKVQNGKKSPNPTPATTLTEEELARRDSAPPSFLCGRSFGRSDGVLLPLRSKERHVHSLENSPSPTSERGLQDLTRGEQPQLLWERSLSPDARANRSSLISFGKPENFDTGDRSTASKSPGRPVTTSRSPSSRVSPRSHGTPSPMGRSGRSTSPYSNRAIYVSDTPWSRPPPSPVATKAWK